MYGLKKSYSCPSFEWHYNLFAHNLIMLNSAVNFIVFTLCGRGFRSVSLVVHLINNIN